MHKVNVNEKHLFELDGTTVNGKDLQPDFSELGDGRFHVLLNDKSYSAQLVSVNHEEKKVIVRVNGNDYSLDIQDRYDLLLKELGIQHMQNQKVNDIKAPMPGLIVSFQVNPGDTLAKGDAVLILEAMKMENVLKSPGDGIVKEILVAQGEAVEKGQVLIRLE